MPPVITTRKITSTEVLAAGAAMPTTLISIRRHRLNNLEKTCHLLDLHRPSFQQWQHQLQCLRNRLQAHPQLCQLTMHRFSRFGLAKTHQTTHCHAIPPQLCATLLNSREINLPLSQDTPDGTAFIFIADGRNPKFSFTPTTHRSINTSNMHRCRDH